MKSSGQAVVWAIIAMFEDSDIEISEHDRDCRVSHALWNEQFDVMEESLQSSTDREMFPKWYNIV